MAMNLHEYTSQERGRLSGLAKSIGAHAPDVSCWADGSRPIPIRYGAAIEIATGGLVTRKDMFPDTWQTIWPELANAASKPSDLIEGAPIDGKKVREAKGKFRVPKVDTRKLRE
jgi:DNA-binding transcriptional regulator YdaS (Cro superfamily)